MTFRPFHIRNWFWTMTFLFASPTPSSAGWGWLTETGSHEGLLLRMGTSIDQGVDVRYESKSGAMVGYEEDIGEGINLVLGHSVVPGWNLGLSLLNILAPIETGFSDFSWGPNLIVYGPLNSHVSGYYGWSKGDTEAGGDIKGRRWSLAVGKELLFGDAFGIGLAYQYQSGTWKESFGDGSNRAWEASGSTWNITLTYN